MKDLKLAYFGSPDFAADFLERIISDPDLAVKVELVVTQPDKPVGRKQVLTPSPVKTVALHHGLAVAEDIAQATEFLKTTTVDLAILYAYGEFIPKTLRELPTIGFWNIHPSLLPMYRNVAPIAYPIMLGEKETGVTLIELDNQLDHGPVIEQTKLEISPTDTQVTMEKKLTEAAYQLLKKILQSQMVDITIKEQDHTKATYTRRLQKNDGFIAWSTLTKALENKPFLYEEFPQIMREYWEKYPGTQKELSSAAQIYNFYRALYGWPGIWTTLSVNGQEKRLKLTELSMEHGLLQLKKVQLEGKNEVDFETFSNAYLR